MWCAAYLWRVDAVEEAIAKQVLHNLWVIPDETLPEPRPQLLVALQTRRKERLRSVVQDL